MKDENLDKKGDLLKDAKFQHLNERLEKAIEILESINYRTKEIERQINDITKQVE